MNAFSSMMLAAGDAVETTNNLSDAAQESKQALVNAFAKAYHEIVSYAPTFIAAVGVLVVGVIVARLIGQLVTTICDKLGLQATAERGGLMGPMRQVGITRSVPQVVGTIVFWTLMWVVLLAACRIFGLSTAEAEINRVVAFVPKLFVASIVLVAGLLLATFLKGVAATSADRVGLTYASQLATAVYWVLAIMTFNTAAHQLSDDLGLFDWALKAFVVALAAALGLSFGLGGKDVMAGILAGYYLRQRFAAGDQVTVAGFEGRVREVGPVATVIETEEEGLLHRRSIPNGRMLSEAVR